MFNVFNVYKRKGNKLEIEMKKEEEEREPLHLNLEKDTINNTHFRNVIQTMEGLQIVLMSIEGNIPNEIHPHTDQFIRVEKGKMLVRISSSLFSKHKEYIVNEGESFTIPRGTYHEIINISPFNNDKLKIYTIYSKKMHKPHLIQEENEKEVEEDEEDIKTMMMRPENGRNKYKTMMMRPENGRKK